MHEAGRYVRPVSTEPNIRVAARVILIAPDDSTTAELRTTTETVHPENLIWLIETFG